jgi:GNAT superfamily N-acetyltransferase
MAIHVRDARPDDADIVVRLAQELSVIEDQPLDFDAARYVAGCFGPSRTLDTLIAERYGKKAGYLTSCRTYDNLTSGRNRVVFDLCVDEPVRRHGVARALLGHVAGTMLSQGEHVLTIATSLGNHAARATYEALGARQNKIAVYSWSGVSLTTLAYAGGDL